MNILFCTNAFENVTNGPAKFAHLLLEINKTHPGHQIRILTEDVTQPDQHVYRVPLTVPRLLKPLGQLLRMHLYYRQARHIRKEFPYDVLVFNNAYTGLWASLVSGQPTVGMINDEKNIRATWAAFRPDRWWLKQFFFRQLEHLSTRTHRLLITNSDFLRHRVEQAYRLPAHKVFRLYKAVDIQSVAYRPDRAFSDPVKVLFVKADYRVGNLHVLAEALAQLAGYRFRLTVIGPEPRFETDIRRFFAGKPTVELNYLGPQPQAVVYGHLRTDDIFCVPSNTEALGVANMEALAHGMPVVSSRVGGIPEVLAHGENGWLAPPGDAAGLAAVLRSCLENPALRLAKSARGREALDRFGKTEMLEKFLSIMSMACM